MELVVLGEDLNHITEITDEPNLKNKNTSHDQGVCPRNRTKSK